MNLTRYSEALAVGVLCLIALGAVGTAAAVTIGGSPPAETEVGTDASMVVEVEDPFEEQPDEWTLRGETELDDATWDVELLQQGRVVDRVEGAGETIDADLDIDDGITRVEVEVSGTTPAVESYSYDDPATFTVASINRVVDDGTQQLERFTAHHYTSESQAARQSIDDAAEVADRDALSQAITAYDDENFELATDLADEAREEGESSAQTTQLLMIGGGALVVLLLIGGGLYLYRERQRSTHKLQ